MAEAQVETKEEAKSSTESAPTEEKVSKKGRKKGTKRSTKRATKRKKKAPVYNVDVHPDTGAMRLPELHYLRLVNAEQKIKITDRDLQIAKSKVNEFQIHASNQLQQLQARVKETSNSLFIQKTSYMDEVKAVEDATGLDLKDWTIDDDRILRPVESKKPLEN